MKLLAALALLAVTLAPAHAGGLHATIEGPAKDGVTYTVRAVEWSPDVAIEPWVILEGLLDGQLKSWRIELTPSPEPGVYTFRRGWPLRGDWFLRVNLGPSSEPPKVATVAGVGHDGRVQQNHHFPDTYGVPECRREIARIAKAKGIKLPEGC